MKKNLFDSLKKEDIQKLQLVKEKIQKEELTRYKFTTKEYEEIIHYCTMLGYVSHKKEKGKVQMNNGRPAYASPSINNQMKTVKIFNSKTHKWGFIQKLKNGIFYGYFSTDNQGNATFVPKYDFAANLATLKLMLNVKDISLSQLKTACGIVELETSF